MAYSASLQQVETQNDASGSACWATTATAASEHVDLSKLHNELAKTAGERDRASMEVKSLKTANQASAAEIRELRKELESVRNSAAKWKKQAAGAGKELAAVRREGEGWKRKVAVLEQSLGAERAESAKWKAQSQKFEQKLAAGAEAYEELARFRGELRGAIKEFDTLKAEMAEVRGELQDPQERHALKRQVAALTKDKETLQSEIKATVANRDEVAKMLGESTDLLAQANRSEKQHVQQIAGLKRAQAQAAKSNKRLENVVVVLEEKLKAKARENAELRAGQEAMVKTSRKQAAELRGNHEQLAVLQKEVARLREQAAPNSDEVKAARVAAEKAEQARLASEQALNRMKSRLAESTGKVRELDKAKGEAQKRLMDHRQQLKVLRDQVRDLQAAKAVKEGEVNKATARK